MKELWKKFTKTVRKTWRSWFPAKEEVASDVNALSFNSNKEQSDTLPSGDKEKETVILSDFQDIPLEGGFEDVSLRDDEEVEKSQVMLQHVIPASGEHYTTTGLKGEAGKTLKEGVDVKIEDKQITITGLRNGFYAVVKDTNTNKRYMVGRSTVFAKVVVKELDGNGNLSTIKDKSIKFFVTPEGDQKLQASKTAPSWVMNSCAKIVQKIEGKEKDINALQQK